MEQDSVVDRVSAPELVDKSMVDRDSMWESFEEEEPPPPAAAARGTEERNWAELPRDVLSVIFRKIGSIEIMMGAQSVCRSWRQLALEPQTWRCIDMTGHAALSNQVDMEVMARLAIDRSGGLLEEFYAENCGNDELMLYICERTDRLKGLRLISCYDISDEALAEIAKKFVHLEELEVSQCRFSEEVFASVGLSCQQLKHFRLNAECFNPLQSGSDLEAFAVANSMQGLQHLQLFANKLTNDGLHAILDKCSQLESLDISCCFNVIVDESIRKKCGRIRNLKLPSVLSTYGYDLIADSDADADSLFGDHLTEFDEMYDDLFLEFAVGNIWDF